MACHESQLRAIELPGSNTTVHKEECTVCFHSQDDPNGVLVCLATYVGFCDTHFASYAKRTGHTVALRFKRVEIPKDPERQKKITKLAIGVEGGADSGEKEYTYETSIVCVACNSTIPSDSGNLPFVIDAVKQAAGLTQREALKAWELVPKPCEHTLCMQQVPVSLAEKSRAKCSECDINENLWMCLVCGFLGCGRQQFVGGGKMGGGNNHALEHATSSKHGVAVKLGTIAPNGTADLWCYICDDGVLDPELASHLSQFGINIADEKKTAQSTQEMELEGSLKLLTGLGADDGAGFQPAFGPGLTGMHNLGNSCYMASTMQALLSLPTFTERYVTQLAAHAASCTAPDPSQCFHCQMYKLASSLQSGRYSRPDSTETNGVRPAMFKALMGAGHPEFSTGRQQDALEYLQHVLKTVEQKERPHGVNPTSCFGFTMESRLQCLNCKKVRYSTQKEEVLSLPLPEMPPATEGQPAPIVPLAQCLEGVFVPETVEFNCPACGSNQLALKQNRLSTFPSVLLVALRRESFVNWVPVKRDTRVDAPLSLAIDPSWRATGLVEGEEALPEDDSTAEPQFDAGAMAALQGMGFPEIRCKRALLAVNHAGAEAAMEWLFQHMEDPDIDDPLPAATPKAGSGKAPVSEEGVMMLQGMGFTREQAERALRATDNNVERAVDWVFSHADDPMEEEPAAVDAASGDATSNANGLPNPPHKYDLSSFVWHKGSSVQCGHYVAFVRKDGKWIMFNDDKVGASDDCKTAREGAYFYLFCASQ